MTPRLLRSATCRMVLAFAFFNAWRVSRPARLSIARRTRLSRLHPDRSQKPAVWRDILMANREEVLKQTSASARASMRWHVITTENTEAPEELIRSASDARSGCR